MTTTRKPRSKGRVPAFANRQDEAKFWDTHDIADYWQDLKPVRARFARQLSEGITIRLDPQTLAELRSVAGERGVGPTTLARMWILEHLRKERPSREGKGRRSRASAR